MIISQRLVVFTAFAALVAPVQGENDGTISFATAQGIIDHDTYQGSKSSSRSLIDQDYTLHDSMVVKEFQYDVSLEVLPQSEVDDYWSRLLKNTSMKPKKKKKKNNKKKKKKKKKSRLLIEESLNDSDDSIAEEKIEDEMISTEVMPESEVDDYWSRLLKNTSMKPKKKKKKKTNKKKKKKKKKSRLLMEESLNDSDDSIAEDKIEDEMISTEVMPESEVDDYWSRLLKNTSMKPKKKKKKKTNKKKKKKKKKSRLLMEQSLNGSDDIIAGDNRLGLILTQGTPKSGLDH